MPAPSLLDHYIALARLPAWRPYVKHRLEQMARECPELYSHFPATVESALTSCRAQQLASSKPTATPSSWTNGR